MRAASLTICSNAGAWKSANCISATGRSPPIAAPIAMPTMLDSATGVSMIRSAPNSSMKPSETRKTPPRTPTSSPRRMWRSSRRNSPSSVSWTAWTFDFSVTGPLYLFERRELVGPALADETVDRAEDVLAVRLREVVAVVADRDPVRLRGQRSRRHLEVVDPTLDLEDLTEDVRRRATGHVLVDHDEGAGLRDGSHDRPVHVEGEERLHVDDLGAYARVDQILRRLLSGAEVQRREIVGRDLQRVEQVVDVLDVDDGPETAERGADPLTDDRGLADAGVGDAQLAVLGLQTFEHEVHVAELAHVLADDDDPRIALEVLVEAADEQLPAVDGLRAIGVPGRDRFDEEG